MNGSPTVLFGMSKNAAKWDKLWRLGQLSDASVGRVAKVIGAGETLGGSMIDKTLMKTEPDLFKTILKSVRGGLSSDVGKYNHGIFEHYRNILNPIKLPTEGIKKILTSIKDPSKPFITGDASQDSAIRLMKEQLVAATDSVRHSKRLSGISSSFWPRQEYKGLGMEATISRMGLDNPMLGSPSPVYNPLTKSVAAPLGVHNPIARHELGHGIFETADRGYKMDVIRRIHEMMKRNPTIKQDILDSGDGTGLMREAAANVVAGRGNSRAAARFNKTNEEYARSFVPGPRKTPLTIFTGMKPMEIDIPYGSKHLISQVDKLRSSDPTGVDASILTQLVNNHRLHLSQ